MWEKAAQALLEFLLQSNHSLSNNPYLPSFPSSSFLLLPQTQIITAWQAQVPSVWDVEEKHGWRKYKSPNSHLHFVEQKEEGFGVFSQWRTVADAAGRHWSESWAYCALAFVCKALALDGVDLPVTCLGFRGSLDISKYRNRVPNVMSEMLCKGFLDLATRLLRICVVALQSAYCLFKTLLCLYQS